MPNKKLKVGNVPNLRFPEFEGEWEVIKLGELSELITKGTTPKKFISEGIKFIKIECFDGDRINMQKCLFIDENVHKKELKRSELKENDLLFAIAGATIGKVNIVTEEILPANTNQALAIIRLKKNENPKFIYQILKSNIMQKYIKDNISVGAQPNLNLEQINSFSFYNPLSSEQDKIATFLSLIDDRIQTQNKIIEGLKLSKKMLIKKIFNQQLSFDGGYNNKFPDWEEKKIKELFSFKITNSFSREQLNYKNGKVKNIHYGDIHTRFQTLFNVEKEEVPYINPYINIDKINAENYCEIGDMIFADASEDLIDVGKSIEIVNLNNQKLLAGLHTILARPISNTFSIGFCGYLFKSDRIRTQIQKESQGSKVLSISAVRLSNISLFIPCIEEQIKITNFLSSIDSKIDIETRFLKKLEEQKKFLLQNLFV